MNVLFAPDWREGVPYQRLLAEALEAQGVKVGFLRHYRRGFPLARLVRGRARQEAVDVLHLHWPEAYYPRKGDSFDYFRALRFPLDLALARQGRALVLTAHNLRPHNRGEEPFACRNARASFEQADRIIAHSDEAREEIVRTFGIAASKIRVIPHGDLAAALGPPVDREEARRTLGLGPEPIALMFGAIEPYKGIEEMLTCWRAQKPTARLIIAGKASAAYGESLRRLADGSDVEIRLGWLSDEALRLWLSAVDCAVFNYRTVFTSGAASLARSYGVPLLLPARLKTVALDEPSPYVLRFAEGAADLAQQLAGCLGVAPSFDAAAPWREAIAWPQVATATAAVYREALDIRYSP